HVITSDGRAYLATTSEHYDLIVVDAYRQTYIPFYLVTREFFALVRAHLAADGAAALNVERVPGDDRLVQAVSGTLATVFPQTWVWPALRFNDLVVGLHRPIVASALPPRMPSPPGAVRPPVPPVTSAMDAVAARHEPVTDDH